MKEEIIKNIKSLFTSGLSKVVFLFFLYILFRDLDPNIPYLNLVRESWEGRLAVVFIVGMLLFNPSANLIILAVTILFLLYGFLIIIFGQAGFEIFGLIIYVLLVFLLIKLIRKIK